MTFIIRLLQGIIENSFVGDKSFNMELMCGLVSLLTHQYIVCREEKDFTPASLSKKLKSIAEKSVEDTDVSSSDVRVWYAYVSALIAIGEKNEATVTCNQILANACRNTGEVDYDFKQFMNVQGATNLVVIKLEMMLKLPIVDEHGYPQIYNSGDKNIAVVENMDLNSNVYIILYFKNKNI